MTLPDFDQQLAALRDEGERFAMAVERVSPDDRVPSCPDWCVRDLVHHTGGVHRWAALNVTRGQPDPVGESLDEIVGTWPDDASLATWLRAGVGRLADALEAAPPDLEAFTFLPASSPRVFWTRRQLHETTIHRVDAEQAGPPVTAIDPARAADGVEEVLFGFAARPGKLVAEEPGELVLRATDTGDVWTVVVGPDGGETRLGRGGPPDGEISSSASDLYLLLWNRRGVEEMADVQGDVGLVEDWPQRVRVRWS